MPVWYTLGNHRKAFYGNKTVQVHIFRLEILFYAWILSCLVTSVVAKAKTHGRDAGASGNITDDARPAGCRNDGFGVLPRAASTKQSCPDRFVVRSTVFIIWFFIALLAVFGVVSFSQAWEAILIQGSGLPGLSEDDSFGLVLGGSVCIICSGLLAFVILRWRMVVTKKEMVFTPYLGKARTIRLADIRHIQTNSNLGYTAYTEENKKLFYVSVEHKGYVLLAEAISPYIKHSNKIPFPQPSTWPWEAPSEDGAEYLRGERASDIAWFLRKYSDHETDKEVLVSCKSCGLDYFAISVDAVVGAIEVECAYCKEKRLLLDSEDAWDDCEPEKVECPECNSATFNAGVGFVHRRDGDVSRVYIGARCSNCGLLGCPADWGIDYSPTDEMERNV